MYQLSENGDRFEKLSHRIKNKKVQTYPLAESKLLIGELVYSKQQREEAEPQQKSQLAKLELLAEEVQQQKQEGCSEQFRNTLWQAIGKILMHQQQQKLSLYIQIANQVISPVQPKLEQQIMMKSI